MNTCNTQRIVSVSSGGKGEKGGAANTFQAYQASVSDAWDIEVRIDNIAAMIESSVELSYIKNGLESLLYLVKVLTKERKRERH